MNIYINAFNLPDNCFRNVKSKYDEFDTPIRKCCVYGDWSDPSMVKWNTLCKKYILEQRQVQDPTHESVHLQMSNDIIEDMVFDYFHKNDIEILMIATSDINYTDLCYKVNKYGKMLFVHIPEMSDIMMSKIEASIFDMKEIEDNVRLIFNCINQGQSSVVALDRFKQVHNDLCNHNVIQTPITDTDLDILIAQDFICFENNLVRLLS